MNTIKKQFKEMLSNNIMPLFEFELINNDYLIVNLDINDKGVLFSFDSDNKRVAFDGEIEVINENNYLLPFDEYFEQLDYYLEMINNNITEGFLIVNNLLPGAENE